MTYFTIFLDMKSHFNLEIIGKSLRMLTRVPFDLFDVKPSSLYIGLLEVKQTRRCLFRHEWIFAILNPNFVNYFFEAERESGNLLFHGN